MLYAQHVPATPVNRPYDLYVYGRLMVMVFSPDEIYTYTSEPARLERIFGW